jgi:hypothetical protein
MNQMMWIGKGVLSLTAFCALSHYWAGVATAQIPLTDQDLNSEISILSNLDNDLEAIGLEEIHGLDEIEASDLEADRSAIAPLAGVEDKDENRIASEVMPVMTVEESNQQSMGQVTSVTQLSDVRPTDWAYQAVQSLVERYGCIVGYPDGTFRGNQALTRFEFAAGLNACLDRINDLIAAGLAGVVTRGDLVTIQRLQEEFASELAILRGRVDALEARATELEATQFSTTTKLFGQVVMGIQGRSNYDFDFFLDRLESDVEPNFITNTQLSFVTQFDDRSILLFGMQAGSGTTTSNPGLNDFTRLGYESDTGNSFQISDLSFRHLIGRNFALIVGPEGVNAVNTFRGANRVESAGFGPLSRFAQRNPIINIGAGSGGVGFDWQLADWASLQAVYTTSNPEDPDLGLFGGNNGLTTIGTQLVLSPANSLDISLQYINSYSPFGRLFTGVGDDQLAALDGFTGRAPIQTNAFGAGVEWQATTRFVLGGWFGFTSSDLLGRSGSVETTNWMAYLNFPDLFAEGNLGGLYFGQPPRITRSTLPDGRNVPSLINEGNILAEPGGQPDTTYHLEAFYRWRVNDNITLTPGLITVFNPGHNNNNDTTFIWALRTTFSF